MALIPITAWSLQAPNGTVWVPSVSTQGVVSFTSGGVAITATPPIFQGLPDAVVWTPSVSNISVFSIADGSMVLTQRWASLIDANGVQYYFNVSLTGLVTVQPKTTRNSATLSWNANTEPDLAYYQLEATLDQTQVTFSVIKQNSPLAVNHIFFPPADGRWYFRLKAVDTSNNASGYTSLLNKRIIREPAQMRVRR